MQISYYAKLNVLHFSQEWTRQSDYLACLE